MTASPQPTDLFDRNRRALRRARMVAGDGDYFGQLMASALIDRLDDVSRNFTQVLVIGGRDSMLADHLRTTGAQVSVVEQSGSVIVPGGAMVGEEDRLPVLPESYDLILWPGGLESVNDVPGALLRCRLALRPDGLLLGCFIGEGSLPRLRAALAQAETARAAARMHPQIDVRGFGDLIRQIGLALPVIDVDRLTIAYRRLSSLIRDLRAGALTNVLVGRVEPLSRGAWQAAQQHFDSPDGEVAPESIAIIHFSGWAPHPDQPQPARRGSATASLAAALGSPSSDGQARSQPGNPAASGRSAGGIE